MFWSRTRKHSPNNLIKLNKLWHLLSSVVYNTDLLNTGKTCCRGEPRYAGSREIPVKSDFYCIPDPSLSLTYCM